MNLNGKKVVVTGADGFIGSHLVEELVRQGSKVVALSYYNSFNTWGWLEEIEPQLKNDVEVVTGDIRDPDGVRLLTKGSDIVFHLAALIGIPYSYSSPQSYVDTNVKGTLNILQAVRDNNCEKVLVTSTSEVYGSAKYVPIDENHPFQGQSPYSATKIGGDRIAESYFRSFQTPVSIVRPFNTYGPRQSARAIIPTLITQLLSGRQTVSIGNTEPTRDFNFVLDTVNGFIEIAKSDNTIGEEINIASSQEISMGELALKIIELINPEATLELDEQRLRPKDSEVNRLLGDNTKITRLTEWTQRYSLSEGLTETIQWFKDTRNLLQYKSDIYNV